jgi:hypothetical protein
VWLEKSLYVSSIRNPNHKHIIKYGSNITNISQTEPVARWGW